MKKFIFGLLLALGFYTGTSQNLVRNGSFENTGQCPIIDPTIENVASPWLSVFGSPDYYNAPCGLPGSDSATDSSRPFDQDGFMGIQVYGDTGTGFLRDYLHGELTETLDSGKYYRFTFYVKPVNNDAIGRSFGIDNIGMLLTDTLVDTVPSNAVINAEPQIVSNQVIDQTFYWTAICGVYLAQGGEQFITIGNFNTDNNTQAAPLNNAVNPRSAYYLVDFVEGVENDLPQLPEDSLLCENARIDLKVAGPNVSVEWSDGSTAENFLITTPGIYTADITKGRCSYTDTIKVFPGECTDCKVFVADAFTPDGDGLNDEFEVKINCDLLSYKLRIYDRWGRKVFETNSPDVSWDGSDAEYGGIYTYSLEYEYEFLRNSKTVNKRGFFSLLK